ncbi:GtrA family protein [Alicyclobacillus fastidiosus]|uniref:GtrA family protein n=1 Tax=Alicyclobacillus fastidiosus TaxID=392011 RepID=A0ABY6ZFN1_9BACL|nr:GtrA family protein [Alicyclobacillus fastidiosus]WAH41723.1 GtrA family protein [Alicyclobacillus fastidiosus]GMA63406.1 putative membrane protein YngA [Alicyclobacillus fastidiosus]
MAGREVTWSALIRQVIRFGFVGILNTVIDFAMFFALVRFMHCNALVAQSVSYACGLCNSYLWNRLITFRTQPHSRAAQMFKFAVVNGVSYGVSEICLLVLQGWIPLIATKVVITGITLLLNFIGSKWWVFRPGENQLASE